MLGFRALSRVPWATLLLLGGGFAMAAAIQKSGLSAFLSAQLGVVRGLPPFEQVLLASLATVALSAVASNTATIAVMLVVLKDAVAPDVLHHHPLRRHHRLLLRLRPPRGHAAQRHRLRQRLRHHPPDGAHRRVARPPRRHPRRRLVLGDRALGDVTGRSSELKILAHVLREPPIDTVT